MNQPQPEKLSSNAPDSKEGRAASEDAIHSAMVKSAEEGLILRSDVACVQCGQVPTGRGGEYPCPSCGVPTLHDPEEAQS